MSVAQKLIQLCFMKLFIDVKQIYILYTLVYRKGGKLRVLLSCEFIINVSWEPFLQQRKLICSFSVDFWSGALNDQGIRTQSVVYVGNPLLIAAFSRPK